MIDSSYGLATIIRGSKMHFCIKVKRHSAKEILCYLFMIFCFIPFLFPNPIVKTNVQPYAAIIGTLILLFYPGSLLKTRQGRNMAIILGGTFLFSLLVMTFSGISIEAFRGVYNYYALFIIPCSIFIVLEELDEFPENLCKIMILIWVLVASVQFFVYRGFATELISGVRWSYMYRGVVGLASEPSFLGIACFYFFHIIRYFRTQRLFYSAIVLVMGVLFAQSTTGIIFLTGYFVVFLLDIIGNRKGIYIWAASICAFITFIFILNTKLTNSRINQMFNAFISGGLDSVLTDASASVRFNAILESLKTASENFFLPNGFGLRIGSAYGGMLVELGIFALPAIILISFGMAITFNKKGSQIVYFAVITFLLLNNTQIGNPLLLMVIGMNIHEKTNKIYKEYGRRC